MDTSTDCLFCEILKTGRSRLTGLKTHNELPLIISPVVAQLDYFWIKREGFKVTPSHLLVISNRHTPDLLSLTIQEKNELMRAIYEAIFYLISHFKIESFNIGMNIGENAGQTIPHFHCHIFDRTANDTPNPRGGIRNFLPNPLKK